MPQRDDVQPFRGHESDPGVLAAWSKSFLGGVGDDAFRTNLLSDAVSSTYSAGSWVREPDYQWFKDAYPITLIVEGVFRAYISNPSGRQATVQYLREGDVWGSVRTLREGRSFRQRMMYQALLPARVPTINGSRFMGARNATRRWRSRSPASWPGSSWTARRRSSPACSPRPRPASLST